MRILVTGAAGLIGSAVVATLRQAHEVVGLDLTAAPQVDLIADIRDPLDLAGYEAIVHVAALHALHVGLRSHADFRSINVEATARLLDAALASGVKRFVFTSSTSVYGHALEPSGGRAAWIDEAVEPQPRDVYDETKLQAEALVRAVGLSGAILRMSRCFPEPIADMAAFRLHRGIDRRDAARAHALALNIPAGPPETYVISAVPPFLPEDRQILYEDAAAAIKLRVPRIAAAFEARGWEQPRSIGRVYCPARAAAEIGFVAHHSATDVIEGDCDPVPAGSSA